MDFLSGIFNMGNLLYLVLLILAFILTLVTAKYRAVVKEVTDVVEMYKRAMADGILTKDEKQKVFKEVLDVLKELLKLVWKPFSFKVKK